MQGGAKALRLIARQSNSGCADNLWVQADVRRTAIATGTRISFREQGALQNPSGPTGWPNRGDRIALSVVDTRNNVMRYVLQHGAIDLIDQPTFKEIEIQPGAGDLYERDLFADFSTMGAFHAAGAEIRMIVFELTDPGAATLDELCVRGH